MAAELGKGALEAAKYGLTGAVEYVKQHPTSVTLKAVSAAVALCPGVVVIPGFAALGFGTLGPVAGADRCIRML